MDFDDIKLNALEEDKKAWIAKASKSASGICDLVNPYRQRDDCLFVSLHCGSFNFSYRLHWEDDEEDWLIRFPIPGKSMFLDEKVQNEVAVMKYVAQNTNIPLPRVIGYGMAEDNPTGLGPFIIMTWVEGTRMSDYMRKQGTPDKVAVLDPDLDENILKTLYGRMAEILLELWKLDFDRIGSLSMDESTGTWTISRRPLTVDMNELIRACGLNDCTPARTYTSSTDYIMSLIDLQWENLRQQRNSVYRSEYCRQKYTCRYLMQAIAPHFILRRDNYGPFKLFSDDLSPNNVLVDDNLNVTAVIDWEFCYAAPPQFAGSLPWWLILQHPPSLVNEIGPDAFLDSYLPKAEIFLQSLQEQEVDNGLITVENRLSARMRESLESRSVWFNLACRMVIDVDLIYWDLLDDFCWGPTRSMAERICKYICGAEIHKDFEDFVRYKIRHLNEYRAELGETEMIEYEDKCMEFANVYLQLLFGLYKLSLTNTAYVGQRSIITHSGHPNSSLGFNNCFCFSYGCYCCNHQSTSFLTTNTQKVRLQIVKRNNLG